MRDVTFVGTSRKDLQAFPERARRKAGYALQKAQEGSTHIDAVPMKGFGGASVIEVRISDDGDAYRAVYTVAFADVVYVLHCFQKKTQKTSKADLNLAAQRYRDLLKELGQ